MASDPLSPLLERFRVRTRLFHNGPLCGDTVFEAQPGRGFLHLLRDGEMEVSHRAADGTLVRTVVDEPSVLYFPRPIEHIFHNAPVELSDFACAALDFDGGLTHPLLHAVPDVIIVPLDAVASLRPALDLLFTEVDNVNCGNRILADRLFEVVLIQLLRWMRDHADELALPLGLFSGLADERIAPVLDAIHTYPGAAWSLPLMASEAHMSRSAFAARFTETLGQSPGAYLTQWRLTIAQDRLRDGATVSEVSAELGYSNASAFSRVFTQQLGRSPRGWLSTAG